MTRGTLLAWELTEDAYSGGQNRATFFAFCALTLTSLRRHNINEPGRRKGVRIA
jgi:hypothetical protein